MTRQLQDGAVPPATTSILQMRSSSEESLIDNSMRHGAESPDEWVPHSQPSYDTVNGGGLLSVRNAAVRLKQRLASFFTTQLESGGILRFIPSSSAKSSSSDGSATTRFFSSSVRVRRRAVYGAVVAGHSSSRVTHLHSCRRDLAIIRRDVVTRDDPAAPQDLGGPGLAAARAYRRPKQPYVALNQP